MLDRGDKIGWRPWFIYFLLFETPLPHTRLVTWVNFRSLMLHNSELRVKRQKSRVSLDSESVTFQSHLPRAHAVPQHGLGVSEAPPGQLSGLGARRGGRAPARGPHPVPGPLALQTQRQRGERPEGKTASRGQHDTTDCRSCREPHSKRYKKVENGELHGHTKKY